MAQNSMYKATLDVQISNGTDNVTAVQRRERQTQPFFYCRWVANRPKTVFFICLGLHLCVVIASGILFGIGYNLFPTNFESLPMELYTIPYRLRDYAFRDRDKYSNSFQRQVMDNQVVRWERGAEYTYTGVDTYYDTDDGNIFTKTNLRKIQTIEEDITNTPGYSQYCMTVNSSLVCKKPTSIIRYFDGTFADVSPIFYDPDFNNISAVLYEAYTNNATRADFEYFIPKSHTLSPDMAIGPITRSVVLFGCTYSKTAVSKCSTFDDYVEPFLFPDFKSKLQEIRDSTEVFEFYYFSFQMWRKDVINQALKDLLYAVGSMLFIFFFMVIQTHSLWLTCFAVFSIFMSFLGANMIYRCVIGFEYFGFFHILAIFIILGIGADNLFVFCDIWKLTAFQSYPTLAHRLSDSYSKSARSMFITSFTTTVAFVCNAISPLLATRSFGVFAGILVMYNYLSVIIFFPSVVVIYHIYFESFTWPCCRCCARNDSKHDNSSKHKINEEKVVYKNDNHVTNKRLENSPENVSKYSISGNINHAYSHEPYVTRISVNGFQENGELSSSSKGMGESRKSTDEFTDIKLHTKSKSDESNEVNHMYKPSSPSSDQSSPTENKSRRHQRKLVIFFRDYYFRFVTNNIVKGIWILIFIGVVAFFGYHSSKLEPDNENLQIYKPGHNYAQADEAVRYKFLYSPSENLVPIYIMWGMKNKDRSSCNFSSINCRGENQYDDTFDPNPVDSQKALMDFCDTLFNFSQEELRKYRIRRRSENGELAISCFPRNLQTFLMEKGNRMNMDFTLPWNSSKLQSFMMADSYNYGEPYNESFPYTFEIAVQNWLFNGYYNNVTDDYLEFNDLIGEERGEWSQPLKSDSSKVYGNKLKYVVIRVNTTINRFTTGYSEGLTIVKDWESFVSSQVSKMPRGLQGGFQLTRNTWHWLYVQKVMADNAILGIAIGISLAFVIISLSTMNVVIGFFATFSICCTTVGVIGVIPIAGWKLGILVSLNMCMLVGLAVDYVVHLAEGYHTSKHLDRLNRTRDMLEEMGLPVFSGACTTLGASLFMLFADIQFFMQFGIFLFCTIGFSLLFSLGLFTVLMGMFGPEKTTGDLKVLFRRCFCCRR